MRKSIKNISILLFCGVMLLTAMQTMAQPKPPTVDDLLNRFFSSVKDSVIRDAYKLEGWKERATNAATKTAEMDFRDCPSPAAQSLYDEITYIKKETVAVMEDAEAKDSLTRSAYEDCKNGVKDPFKRICDTTYNRFTFRQTANTAAYLIKNLNRTLGVLKALKCPSGCKKTARIVYPTIQFEKRLVTRPSIATIGNSAPLPLFNDITYCSVWKPGTFWANWDTGNGEFNANFGAKLPQCERTNTISVCSEWDWKLLLPKLQKLNFVPTSVSVADLKIEVPNKNVTAISGVKQATCDKLIKISKRASLTFNSLPPFDPLSVLLSINGEMVEIGCANPAFGLEPVSSNVSIPDITRVRISWDGITVKRGYIEVDMTKPELQGACKKGCPSPVTVPAINVGKGYLDLPNVCLEPRLVDLVTNK